MSESEAGEIAEKETKPEASARKRVRHRKKLLYEKIMHQMEFYFSDANLTKDRFLSQLLKEEPFVPLELFLKFNKIRALTQDTTDIAKAMKHSTLLELSADKNKVKRILPVEEYDADARTVYVESIPTTASREWLQQVFTRYGPVAYISLPKYRDSHRIKGFAFIEFNNPEDAENCVAEFTKMGCKLPTGTPPEELTSIKTFAAAPSAPEHPPTLHEQAPSAPEPATNAADQPARDFEPPKKKSRKKEKKEQKGVEWQLTEQDTNAGSGERKTGADSEGRKRAGEGAGAGAGGACKKPTPRPQDDVALWGLQILSKREWKSLRNKYLNLQRAAPRRHEPAPAAAAEPALPGGADDAALPLKRAPHSKSSVSAARERRPPTHIRFEDAAA